MSSFTSTTLSTESEKFVQYLREQSNSVAGGSLKTCDFLCKATKLLKVSRSKALELSVDLDFEDGKLFNVASLFDLSKNDKPLRQLYKDAIHSMQQSSTQQQSSNNLPTALSTGAETTTYDEVEHLVDAMVADLYNVCCGGYALDSAAFLNVALRHDLRRSEAWRLLGTFDFEEGLCVSATEKWFDEQHRMRDLYWNSLADTFLLSVPAATAAAPLTVEQKPSWAFSGLLQQSTLKKKKQKKNSSTSSSPSFSPLSSTAPSPTSARSSVIRIPGSTLNDNKEYVSSEEEEEVDRISVSSLSSTGSRSQTPDWGSSHKWKKRIQYEYGEGGGA